MKRGANILALVITLVIAGSMFSGMASAANTSESLTANTTNAIEEAASIDNPIVSTSDVSLGEALDNIELSWTTGGRANWFGQINSYYYGGDAAQSGHISHNQNSWIQTTVTGPGALSFYWRAISEPYYDFIEFQIDGVRQDRISATGTWVQMRYDISSGLHTLRWNYRKDESESRGSDCGWVDKVVFTPSSTDQAEILEFEHTTGTVNPGSTGAAVVTIQNTGTTTRSFWVGLSYEKQGASEWIDLPPQQSVDIYPGGSANVQFSWTLTTELGTYDIFTKIWNGYDSSTGHMIPPSYDDQIDEGAFTIATSEHNVKFQGVVTDLLYCYCVGHNTAYNRHVAKQHPHKNHTLHLTVPHSIQQNFR